MIFLVWLVLCYFVWPTVEILVTGSRTVSTTDDWMSLFFLLAMYWCYKVGKCESDTHKADATHSKCVFLWVRVPSGVPRLAVR